MIKKILITGGAGFTGAGLVEFLLDKGYKVVVIDNLSMGSISNLSKAMDHRNFSFYLGDVTNKEDCKHILNNVFGIVHLANPGTRHSGNNYNHDLMIGLVNLLMNVKANQTRFLIYTIRPGWNRGVLEYSAFDFHPDSNPSWQQVINDCLSKIASTHGESLSTVPLRVINLFGERQDPESSDATIIPKLAVKLATGKSPLIDDHVNTERQYTYTGNLYHLIHAIFQVKHQFPSGCTVDTTDEVPISTIRLAIWIREMLSRLNPDIAQVPVNLLRFQKDPEPVISRNLTLVRAESGFIPPYSFRQALAQTVFWYWCKYGTHN